MASIPLSVSSSVITCDSNDSLIFVDDVHVVSVDTLVYLMMTELTLFIRSIYVYLVLKPIC